MFGEGGELSTAAVLRELQGVSLPELKEFFPEEYKKIVELNPAGICDDTWFFRYGKIFRSICV